MKKEEAIRSCLVGRSNGRLGKEVMNCMKKENGKRTWAGIVMALGVIGMSLFFVQMAVAANYTIAASAGANGTIAPSGNVGVPSGAKKVFTITPAAKFIIGTLLVDGAPVAPYKTYTFTNVTAAHTISVTFAPDADDDGFSNDQELNGITLADGTFVPGKNTINQATGQSYARADRLDPDSKDLFLFLVPAIPSKFPSNPYELLFQSGLPITIHVINPSQAASDRTVSPYPTGSAQKAVRVTESLDPGVKTPTDTTIIFGLSDRGVELDSVTIYTQRILNYLLTTCNNCSGLPCGTATSGCRDSFTNSFGQGLFDQYIKHTIAHEVGHAVQLTSTYNANYNGYHYASGTNVEMDQAIFYKSDQFLFNIGTAFTSADQQAVKLK